MEIYRVAEKGGRDEILTRPQNLSYQGFLCIYRRYFLADATLKGDVAASASVSAESQKSGSARQLGSLDT